MLSVVTGSITVKLEPQIVDEVDHEGDGGAEAVDPDPALLLQQVDAPQVLLVQPLPHNVDICQSPGEVIIIIIIIIITNINIIIYLGRSGGRPWRSRNSGSLRRR